MVGAVRIGSENTHRALLHPARTSHGDAAGTGAEGWHDPREEAACPLRPLAATTEPVNPFRLKPRQLSHDMVPCVTQALRARALIRPTASWPGRRDGDRGCPARHPAREHHRHRL